MPTDAIGAFGSSLLGGMMGGQPPGQGVVQNMNPQFDENGNIISTTPQASGGGFANNLAYGMGGALTGARPGGGMNSMLFGSPQGNQQYPQGQQQPQGGFAGMHPALSNFLFGPPGQGSQLQSAPMAPPPQVTPVSMPFGNPSMPSAPNLQQAGQSGGGGALGGLASLASMFV
jgi:hypothetical protein